MEETYSQVTNYLFLYKIKKSDHRGGCLPLPRGYTYMYMLITIHIKTSPKLLDQIKPNEPLVRKPVFGDLVRHKPDCSGTEDGKRLEILYLGSRRIVLAM